ncbi:MAG: 50S ribosomal protein L13 [Bdellovibrionales bacterium]
MKTWVKKPLNVQKEWKLIDASGKSLGRLASAVSYLLSGKYKPEYTPHVPNGDGIIIINSDKVVLTGKKWQQKKYYTHSRYIGSMKEWSARDLGTETLIKNAVQGMLPKNNHRDKFLKNLRIFKGPEHTYKDKTLQVTKL